MTNINDIKDRYEIEEYLNLEIGNVRKAISSGEDYILDRIRSLDGYLTRLNGEFTIDEKENYKASLIRLTAEHFKYRNNKQLERLEIWKEIREFGLDPDDIKGFTKEDIYKKSTQANL